MAILIISVLIFANPKLIQAENIENINILNLNIDPSTIRVGNIFSINASILNNSINTISVHNGCDGPFSVLFDNHVAVNMEKVCNWMPIQIILKPGENTIVTGLVSNFAYNVSSPW